MKKLIYLSSILFIVFSFQVNAQDFECPPVAWCHPNGSGLGGGPWEYGFMGAMTDAADAVGESSKGDSCSEQSYAEQVFCYPGQWLAGVIACGYGKDTPQYTVCDEGDDYTSESLTASESNALSKVKGKGFALNSKFRPIYLDSKNGKKAIKESLNKMKRGQVIKKWKQGYTLTLGYKFFTSKDKKEYAAMLNLKNKKGKIIATPMLLTKNKRVYIVDIKQFNN